MSSTGLFFFNFDSVSQRFKFRNFELTLESHAATDVTEVFAGREEGDLDHSAGAESSSEVRGAGKDPSEMVVVHEIVSFGLEDLKTSINLLSSLFRAFLIVIFITFWIPSVAAANRLKISTTEAPFCIETIRI